MCVYICTGVCSCVCVSLSMLYKCTQLSVVVPLCAAIGCGTGGNRTSMEWPVLTMNSRVGVGTANVRV